MWISKKKFNEAITEAANSSAIKSEEELSTLKKQLNAAYKELRAYRENEQEMQIKIEDLKRQIRNQSEADMVLAALRVVKRGVEGSPVKTDFHDMQRYQEQLRAGGMSAGMTNYQGCGSALNTHGLRGLLGL